MRPTIKWIIRDAETGYSPNGIPQWRTYASEAKAKRAAQRLARATGRAMAYGWAAIDSDTIDGHCGEITPPAQS